MTKWAVSALVAMTLTACASSGGDKKPSAQATEQATTPVQTNVKFDSYAEVAYKCKEGKVLAMYGIKDNVVAGVQVVHQDIQSPLMLRTTNPKYNEFSTSGRHITWTQNLASPADVKTAKAQGLSRLVTGKNPDGSAGVGVGVVAGNCDVDKAMTAQLPNMKDEDKVKWLGK
ncbi:hypothetical protein LVJ82_05745 [Vitreoscilla massiliensis]|uniref:Lipoprotein n=2 Tax=Vitreoscilla massiliensis TaxID=1689272 RepID=A0ABY4E3W8_9NEIS|nr:hypothetical protein [Vitreoscilla massiliensis]UOO90476.1 hypothetical protein LVJ82_05745 [Vitreoscilla massiliensis]